jgi:hypothetical protein
MARSPSLPYSSQIEIELENARFRPAVSDLTLDKQLLKEAGRGKFFSIQGSSVNLRSKAVDDAMRQSWELLLLSEVGVMAAS